MRLWIIVGSVILSSCASVKTFKGAAQPSDPYTKSVHEISCDTETLKKKSFTLPRQVNDYEFVFQSTCPQQGEDTTFVDDTKTMRVMWVLDMTGSMGPSFKVVKDNLLTLSQKLSKMYLNVFFAAVGFADFSPELRYLSFSDAQTLRAELGEWTLTDGGDYQEGGQQALRLGLKRLEEAAAQVGADKERYAIVYVSDAPAFAEDSDDHMDFSMSTLMGEFRKSPLANLIEFYAAIPETKKPEGLDVKIPDLKTQLKELSEAKVFKKWIDLVATSQEAMLGAFTQDIVEKVQARKKTCFLQEVSLSSVSSSKLPYREVEKNVFSILQKGGHLTFKRPPNPEDVRLWMDLVRCCGSQDSKTPPPSCQDVEKLRFEYLFGVKKS